MNHIRSRVLRGGFCSQPFHGNDGDGVNALLLMLLLLMAMMRRRKRLNLLLMMMMTTTTMMMIIKKIQASEIPIEEVEYG